MAESKVQFTTKADVSGLKAWTATVIDAARALDKMTDAQKRNEDATGGGAAGGTTPTPSPVSPVAPMPDAAYSQPSPWFTPPNLVGPPPPPASPAKPGGKDRYVPNYPEPSGWFVPVDVPAPSLPPPPSDPGGGRGGGGGGGSGGGRSPRPEADPTSAFSRRVSHGLTTGLGMGVGMALGGSALGFIMSAGEEFMEVDRILGQLDQRFGDAQGIRQFGAQLGYTVEQAASLATILGAVEGSFSSRVASRYTGFARVSGLDPQQTVGQLAVIGRMSGAPLSNAALSSLAGGAESVGMGRGRLNEYLDVVGAMMAQQQQVMGSADVTTQQRTLELISRAFGGRDVGTGRNALDIAGRLQGVMTGGGLTPFLMRAMGYGRDPNISWTDIMKQSEAGINDPRNLTAIFDVFQQRGLSREQMTRSLYSVSGGQLKVSEIEALVNQLATPEGLEAYNAGGKQTGTATDYAAAGAGTVRTGEARAVQLQGMKLDVGDTVAQMMGDLTAATQNLMKASENLFGGGIGDVATGLSGAIVKGTEAIETATALIEDMWRWWKGDGKPPPDLTPEQRRIDAEAAPKPGQRPPAGANLR